MNDDTLMKETGRGFYLNENVGAVNSIPLTGDGVRLARKLGAVPDGMELMLTSYCDGDRFPRNAETQRLWDLMMFSFPYLWVNKEGERFVNEGLMNGCYLANAIANQTDGTYYMILDHATKEKIRTEGPDIWGYLSNDIQIDMDELFDKVIEGGSKNYFRAESIEDLADQIQVPVETLKATIKRYNADCAVGYDSLFNKKRNSCVRSKKQNIMRFAEKMALMEALVESELTRKHR